MQASTVHKSVRLVTLTALVVVTAAFAGALLLLFWWPVSMALGATFVLAASVGIVCSRALRVEGDRLGGTLAFPATIFGLGLAFGVGTSMYGGLLPETVEQSNILDAIFWRLLTFRGLVVGVPLGLSLSIAVISPIRAARHLSTKLSVETVDLLLRHLGSWLIGVAALGLGFGAAPVCILGARGSLTLSAAMFVGFAALGVLLWAVAAARIERRIQWYERIYLGQESNWSIKATEELNADLEGLLPLRGSVRTCDAVIVRHHTSRLLGAYRTGEELQPYALVAAPLTMQTAMQKTILEGQR